MKLAHVITAISLGGAERVAEDLSVAFRAQGIDVHIIALIASDPELNDYAQAMRERLTIAGIQLHELGARDKRLGLIAKLPALARLIRHERFDIIHAHVDHADFAVSLVARTWRGEQRPALARTIHNSVLWPGHPWLARISEAGWRDELVIAVSPAAMDAHLALRQQLKLAISDQRKIILNGIPIGAIGDGAGSGPLRIAFFGRSTPQKGLDLLLAALRALPPSIAPFTMTLYSDAARDPAIQEQVRNLRNITLLPPIVDARDQFGKFDLIIMPSRFEGLPLVAIEAFAAGTPVLATDAPGLRDVLPADWPLMVPSDDVVALRDQLAIAITAPETVRILRRAAAAHGSSFAIGPVADQYLKAYNTALTISVG